MIIVEDNVGAYNPIIVGPIGAFKVDPPKPPLRYTRAFVEVYSLKSKSGLADEVYRITVIILIPLALGRG